MKMVLKFTAYSAVCIMFFLVLCVIAAACSAPVTVPGTLLRLDNEHLTWDAVDGAECYFLRVDYDDTNGYEIPVYSATEYSINIYKAGSYRYRVRFSTPQGLSDYSNEVVYKLQKDISTSQSDDKTVTYRGTGAADDPILISSANELLSITTGTRNRVENDVTLTDSLYYLQTQDIDLQGAEVAPFATGSLRFSGYYDGGNHSISNFTQNKTYGNAAYTYVGLFGALKSAAVINLSVTGYSSDISYVGNGFSWGVIAGYAEASTVENCFVSGDININSPLQTEYLGYAGLIVGESKGTAILRCTTQGSVNVSFSRAYAGGIAGLTKLTKGDVIRECRSTASVTAHGAGRRGSEVVATAFAGGLIGYASRFETLSDCWYSGELKAQIVDGGTVDCYGTGLFGGGNCRSSDGLSYLTFTDCYFNYQKMGLSLTEEYPTASLLAARYAVGSITKKQASATKVFAFNDLELPLKETYAQLDFENCWEMGDSGPVIKPYTAVFPNTAETAE